MAEAVIMTAHDVEVQKNLVVSDGNCGEWNTLVQTDVGNTVGTAVGLELITDWANETALLARSGYVFDTTAIPEGAVVTDARVLLYGQGYFSGVGETPVPTYGDVQVRKCELSAGGGDYRVLANFGLIHDGAPVGVMEYGGPGEGESTWWESPNLASLFTRTQAWAVGFNFVKDNNDPPEGCPPIPYLSVHEEYTVAWCDTTWSGKEPKLVVTYTEADPEMTLNTVTENTRLDPLGSSPWIVIGQTDDARGNETLRAAETGKHHYLRKIRVDMCPGATAASFTINSDDTPVIGPVDLMDGGMTTFEKKFDRPLEFGSAEAIKLDTEGADQIHVILEGFTV